jgi:hypothetical protein
MRFSFAAENRQHFRTGRMTLYHSHSSKALRQHWWGWADSNRRSDYLPPQPGLVSKVGSISRRRIQMKKFLFSLLVASLFTALSAAQTYESGSVLKWEMKSYSQSANIIRNHVVYTVKVGDATYQIAKRSDKVELSVGQRLECRVDKSHFFVLNAKGKETKYDIEGTE